MSTSRTLVEDGASLIRTPRLPILVSHLWSIAIGAVLIDGGRRLKVIFIQGLDRRSLCAQCGGEGGRFRSHGDFTG